MHQLMAERPNMNKNKKGSLVALTTLFLAGCGGGGASNGGGGTPPPNITEPPAPAVSYSGNRQPATIDKQNAPAYVAAVISMRSLMQLGESLWIQVPSGSGGVINETVAGSSGGSAVISGNVNTQGAGFLDVDYREFSEAGVTLDGRYIQRYRAYPAATSGVIFSDIGTGTLEFDNLSVTTAGGTLLLRGVMELSGSNKEHFELDLLVEDRASGETWYFESAAIDFTGEKLVDSFPFGLSLSGTVYESVTGSVQVSPTAPMLDLEISEQNGYLLAAETGGFRIASAGPLLEFLSLSRSYAALIMDSDGDGMPEEGRRISWGELAGIPETAASVTAGPIANPGVERLGKAGEQFTLHGLFSHDDDGDWLTYEWSLASRPPDSDLTLDEPGAPVQSFVPDVVGDYILTLRVSDGANVSEASVLAGADDRLNGFPVTASLGALEVAPPFAAGAPVLVDGRAAAYYPHNPSPMQWWSEGPGIRNLNTTADLYIREFTTDRPGYYRVNTSIGLTPQAWSTVSFAVGDLFVSTETEWGGVNRGRDFMPNDFNQDGITDLAIRVEGSGFPTEMLGFELYVGQGDGKFDKQPTLASGRGEIAVGDLNNDGRPDFAVADGKGIYVTLQAADRTFSDFTLHAFPGPVCDSRAGLDIGIADVNGDGRNDLVGVEACDASLIVWLQNVSGALDTPQGASTGERVAQAAFADIDNDGRTDAIFLSAQFIALPAAVVVATGQPDGTFAVRERIETAAGVQVSAFGVGDINIDGRPDLLIFSGSGIVTIFEQQSDGSWHTIPAGTVESIDGPAFVQAAHVIDVDDDGDNDFLLCAFGRRMWIGTRQQNGSYRYAQSGSCETDTGAIRNSIAVMDFNGDGKSDIIANDATTLLLATIHLGGITGYSRVVN
jgi:hypothetical protein